MPMHNRPPANPAPDHALMTHVPPHEAPLTLQTLTQAARGPLQLAGAATSLSGVFLIAQAGAITALIHAGFNDRQPFTALLPWLITLLAVGLLRALLTWGARSLADTAAETIRHQLRLEIVKRLQARGPLWLRRQRSGALAELTGAHVDALDGYVGGFLLARTEMIWVPLALLIATFWADITVGTILLLTLPLIPLFMALVGWGAQAASDSQLQAMARMSAHFADRLRGLGLIRLYGYANAALSGIRQAAEGVRDGSMKVLRIAFLSSAVLEFFASIGVAMVALYLGLTYLGLLDLRTAPLSLSTGLFCLLLAPEVYAPLRRLAAHYHDRAGAKAAVENIAAALADQSPAPVALPVATQHTPSPALISVCNLQLRHVNATCAIVRQLSFDLAPGQHLALAGPSGCGKSTLLESLAGWLPPEHGTILHVPDLRIGYAPQRPHLFCGSIADNLRLAAPHATDPQLHAAAEAAQVLRFTQSLPQGLETRIGEGGFGLSGGQARRVALARVFLQDPQLLLLDEPTAFLDADTEAALLEALLDFSRGRTLLIATHSAHVMHRVGEVLWLGDDANPHVRRAA